MRSGPSCRRGWSRARPGTWEGRASRCSSARRRAGPRVGGRGVSIPRERLVVGGPYRYCRNPMYLGHLIFFAGIVLALHSWIAAAVFAFHAVWFHRRVRDDETRLAALFGDPYRDY